LPAGENPRGCPAGFFPRFPPAARKAWLWGGRLWPFFPAIGRNLEISGEKEEKTGKPGGLGVLYRQGAFGGGPFFKAAAPGLNFQG